MKSKHALLSLSIFLFLGNMNAPFIWAKAQSQPAGAGPPVGTGPPAGAPPAADSQPASPKVDSQSMLQDAMTLLEIYSKIRKIVGQTDRSELTPVLNQLNKLLDRILSFKNSFTPRKMEKINRSLSLVQKDILDLGNVSLRESDKQLDKLTDSIFNLMRALLEPAPEERI